jgi:hypothetical protein
MMREAQPELAWLKREFKLTDADYARLVQLHNAYLPQCMERCRLIEEQNQKLHALLAQSTNVTPEVRTVLAQRAQIRADCEAAMLEHFLEVSRTMPPEQGRRYLAWVEGQSGLCGAGMEQRHGATSAQPASAQSDPGASSTSHSHHGMEMPTK